MHFFHVFFMHSFLQSQIEMVLIACQPVLAWRQTFSTQKRFDWEGPRFGLCTVGLDTNQNHILPCATPGPVKATGDSVIAAGHARGKTGKGAKQEEE